MINMIRILVEKKLAYPASNGDVYYSVHDFPSYGKLSGKSLDDLRAGERVDIDVNKKIHWILYCGKRQNPESLFGILHGEEGALVGILNVPP